eukprot:scaffold11461_cov104-Isochrysis_galbana.AAC.2
MGRTAERRAGIALAECIPNSRTARHPRPLPGEQPALPAAQPPPASQPPSPLVPPPPQPRPPAPRRRSRLSGRLSCGASAARPTQPVPPARTRRQCAPVRTPGALPHLGCLVCCFAVGHPRCQRPRMCPRVQPRPAAAAQRWRTRGSHHAASSPAPHPPLPAPDRLHALLQAGSTRRPMRGCTAAGPAGSAPPSLRPAARPAAPSRKLRAPQGSALPGGRGYFGSRRASG